jgi:hypothetical protein
MADTATQEQLVVAIQDLTTCASMVRKLALFSTNEDVEEISTSNLSFLQCEYMLSDLKIRITTGDNENRLQDRKEVLVDARTYIETFVLACESYGLVTYAIKDQFKLVHKKIPVSDIRQLKIDSYKQTKQLELKISGWQSNDDNEDDEEIRDLKLKMVELALYRSAENLRFIIEELEMIEYALERDAVLKLQGLKIQDDVRLDVNKKVIDNSTAIMDKDGKVQRPFVITSKRSEFESGVFRPGHCLPTMSIDEYLDKEMERGNFLSSKDTVKKQEIDSDDENEIVKQRKWDEFKDDNVRGWGNRKNKG